jgi:signal transduction histidine kinase
MIGLRMQQAPTVHQANDIQSDAKVYVPRERTRRFLPRRLQPYGVCVITTLIFFIADLVLPRGATPAIGYCFVPVLARSTRQRPFLLAITSVCTILTWIGYALEPAGAVWWVSVFERAMVTGVLWLTVLLVWRRMEAEIAIARQAQKLREAVSELQRSNVELENFASVVSHDIRGPLNSIGLLTQLISSQASIKSDTECSEWLGSIRSEITRMSSLIQRLLAYGRVGAGEVKLSDCDFESVLRSVRQTLRAELGSAGAEITNDPLPTIRADPGLMAELLQNLIENGIKYRRPSVPPRIHVAATAMSHAWLFSVRDNGIGMAVSDSARVFEPFYRVPTAGNSTGFGLGLATCKRIVARHGGRIEMQSIPGQGSTFTFLIPNLAATNS